MHVVEGLAPRFGPHDHAGSAAVRGVVDGAVPIGGRVAQVVHLHVEQPGRPGLADERQLERREVLREDRDDVDAHVRPRRGPRAAACLPAGRPSRRR